jgi:hypothetical protein
MSAEALARVGWGLWGGESSGQQVGRGVHACKCMSMGVGVWAPLRTRDVACAYGGVGLLVGEIEREDESGKNSSASKTPSSE